MRLTSWELYSNYRMDWIVGSVQTMPQNKKFNDEVNYKDCSTCLFQMKTS